jgi:hypothetical protein
MTPRFAMTLGALALGLAAFGAAPALAQGNAGSQGGNAPTQAGTVPNTGAGNLGTGSAGNANHAGSMGHAGTAGHATPHHAANAHPRRHAARQASAGSTTEGDDAVARLNERSLQAAKQGQDFTAGGSQQKQ